MLLHISGRNGQLGKLSRVFFMGAVAEYLSDGDGRCEGCLARCQGRSDTIIGWC